MKENIALIAKEGALKAIAEALSSKANALHRHAGFVCPPTPQPKDIKRMLDCLRDLEDLIVALRNHACPQPAPLP